MPGYYRQNTVPLTGRPSTDDRQDVPQPRLESARPLIEDTYNDGLYRDDVEPYATEDKSVTTPKSLSNETSAWRPRGILRPQLNAPVSSPGYAPEEPATQRLPASSTDPLAASTSTKSPFPGTREVEIDHSNPKAPTQVYSDVMPIRAPEGYKSPYAARQSFDATTSATPPRLQAPE